MGRAATRPVGWRPDGGSRGLRACSPVPPSQAAGAEPQPPDRQRPPAPGLLSQWWRRSALPFPGQQTPLCVPKRGRSRQQEPMETAQAAEVWLWAGHSVDGPLWSGQGPQWPQECSASWGLEPHNHGLLRQPGTGGGTEASAAAPRRPGGAGLARRRLISRKMTSGTLPQL